MQVISVKKVLAGAAEEGTKVEVRGWVRTRRDSKAGISFVNVSDGSTLRPHPGGRPGHAAPTTRRKCCTSPRAAPSSAGARW